MNYDESLKDRNVTLEYLIKEVIWKAKAQRKSCSSDNVILKYIITSWSRRKELNIFSFESLHQETKNSIQCQEEK